MSTPSDPTPSSPASQQNRTPLIIAAAIVLAALIVGGAVLLVSRDDDTAASLNAEAPTESGASATPAAPPPAAAPAPPAAPAPAPAPAPQQSSVNAQTRQAAAEAQGRWLQSGTEYTWGYEEFGEGQTTNFCVEGNQGSPGASNAPACPFSASTSDNPRGVDDYFDIINSIAASDEAGGRMVDATFDEETGIPLSITISGGETDSLQITTINFEVFDATEPS